jgi:hypothetical protein
VDFLRTVSADECPEGLSFALPTRLLVAAVHEGSSQGETIMRARDIRTTLLLGILLVLPATLPPEAEAQGAGTTVPGLKKSFGPRYVTLPQPG